MDLMIVDYGVGSHGLEGLLEPLSNEFNEFGVDYLNDVMSIKYRKHHHYLRNDFIHWMDGVSRFLSDGVIGLTVAPYTPSEKDLGISGFVFHSDITRIGFNNHYNLIVIDMRFLEKRVSNVLDYAFKIGLHELFELLLGHHTLHIGEGEPCVNNGDVSVINDDPDVSAINYINSLKPVLCDYCRGLIRDELS